MNTQILKLIITLLIALGLTACTVKKQVAKYAPLPKKTLTAMGYGTVEETRYVPSQRRLMGMRASKMEAYRALAEQIYGVRLNSNTTIENMIVKNDSYRSYIDAVVRGARVKRITAIDANTYETVMEVELTAKFFECLAGSEALVNSCLNAIQGIPMSRNDTSVETVSSKTENIACNHNDCYGYPQLKGFTHSPQRPDYATEMLQVNTRQLIDTHKQLFDGMIAMTGYH